MTLLAGMVALACSLCLAPRASAADGCANAALRSGAAGRLPDCRAWEQVSPVQKNGVDVVSTSAVASVDGGDHVYFNAAGAFAGAESVLYDTAYVSARGGDWTTRGTDPALTPTGLLVKATLGLSEDGTKAVVVTSKALAPGAIEGGSNLYVRDLTQPSSYRLVVATDTPSLYANLTGFGGQGGYHAGNDDLSAFAFTSATPLLDEAPAGMSSLYLWHDGRLSLASRLPDGTTPDLPNLLANTPSRDGRRISEDGTRIWFTYDNALYQYAEGEGTTLISRSHRAGDDPTAPATIDGAAYASPDGREIVFVASGALTDESDVPSRGAIYRWSADDDSLIDLSSPYTPAGGGPLALNVLRASSDGRFIWLTSWAPLTPDAGSGTEGRLYVIDTEAGQLRFVANFVNEVGGPWMTRFSPNGHRIAFVSFSPVTGVDNVSAVCREPGSP
ncbi:MAG TPA: hypothetical protein VLK58_19475, partial [Conexibacter sp.]|nr:hypothetical protein [Conexibacter sp.]